MRNSSSKLASSLDFDDVRKRIREQIDSERHALGGA